MECYYLWKCFTLIVSFYIRISLNSITMHPRVQARNRNDFEVVFISKFYPLYFVKSLHPNPSCYPLAKGLASPCLKGLLWKPPNSPPTHHPAPHSDLPHLPECFLNTNLKELLSWWRKPQMILHYQQRIKAEIFSMAPSSFECFTAQPLSTFPSSFPFSQEGLSTHRTTCQYSLMSALQVYSFALTEPSP